MKLLHRTFCLVLCFSICLIGCVLPVSATSVETSGTTQFDTDFITVDTDDGFAYPAGSLPATFTFDEMVVNGHYLFRSSVYEATTSVDMTGGSLVSFIFMFSKPVVLDLQSIISLLYMGEGTRYAEKYGEPLDWDGSIDFCVGTNVYESCEPNGYIDSSLLQDIEVSDFVSIDFFCDEDINILTTSSGVATSFAWTLVFNGSWTAIDDSGSGGDSGSGSESGTDLTEVIDEIKVVQSQLDDISGNVTILSETVIDMRDQLEDPESNIWQAAGQAIKDSFTSLFVPSQTEIEEVKQGFDDLAKDKLGGAYTAMETVDQTITQVNDKLNNPSAAEGVEFPGISVPLGGDVGTVTIVEPQMVTLPLQLTSILHPVAGTIISIVVGLGTFNTLKDMVECFLSGYSYSEFLHRSKVRDDE